MNFEVAATIIPIVTEMEQTVDLISSQNELHSFSNLIGTCISSSGDIYLAVKNLVNNIWMFEDEFKSKNESRHYTAAYESNVGLELSQKDAQSMIRFYWKFDISKWPDFLLEYKHLTPDVCQVPVAKPPLDLHVWKKHFEVFS